MEAKKAQIHVGTADVATDSLDYTVRSWGKDGKFLAHYDITENDSLYYVLRSDVLPSDLA